jgi:capsular exopolysaccharide synthesis family protein
VTSAVAGEGKTTVAMNLAHVIALSGRRTVLVELDLRRPKTFGPVELGAERGVTTAITGAGELGSLLVRPLPDLPNLLVLPSGALPHNPSELLSAERVTGLISTLARDETMVIIDTPPLNPVADTHVLLDNPAIDAAIIVARIDRTTREQMRHARSILDQHKVEPVGVAITGVRDPSRYGYGYGSYEAAPAEPTGGARSRRRAKRTKGRSATERPALAAGPRNDAKRAGEVNRTGEAKRTGEARPTAENPQARGRRREPRSGRDAAGKPSRPAESKPANEPRREQPDMEELTAPSSSTPAKQTSE